ncbi:MAG: hypothetical protein IJA65_05110, partial [Acholeplasmatales bacterium]|nr:hypothetical protein [Acholeplasmatales bacterium]
NSGYIEESLLSFTEYIESNNNIVNTTKVIKEYKNSNKMSSNLRNELDKLTEEIPILEEKLSVLKLELSKESTDYRKILELQEEISNLELEIDNKMERLLELEEIKESFKK